MLTVNDDRCINKTSVWAHCYSSAVVGDGNDVGGSDGRGGAVSGDVEEK